MEIPRGGGGGVTTGKSYKRRYEAKLEIPWKVGPEGSNEKSSMGEVWIYFSGTTQSDLKKGMKRLFS